MRHRVGSAKANTARKRREALATQQRKRVDLVLQKYRESLSPKPSAVTVAEMKMPGARVLEGYGSVFDLPDYQGDIVARGAFDEWLRTYNGKKAPIPLLLEHRANDPEAIMGWAQSLSVDHHGLWARFGLLAEHGEDVLEKVRSGQLDGLSIGYIVDEARHPTWTEKEKGATRILTAIRVREISLVRTPANTASRAYSVKTRAQVLAAEVRAAVDTQRRLDALCDVTEDHAMNPEDVSELQMRIDHVLGYVR